MSALGRAVRSVRFRVTAVATVVTFVVLALAALVLVADQRSRLTSDLDGRLLDQAEQLADQAEDGTLPTELPDGADDAVAQVVVDGVVVAASEDLEGEEPLDDAPANGEAARTVRGLGGDDDEQRLVSLADGGGGGGDDDDDDDDDGARGGDGRSVVVHVAADLDDVHEATDALRSGLAPAVPAVVLVLAGLIWLVVGRMLAPVAAIRAEAASIGGTDLHRRLPVPASGDEVARLAETFNDLLDRVEVAARRQQQFVADASHDLRSPLTRIRTELEVDLARPSEADPMATHRSVLAEAVGLQRLVDDLLLLARSDEAGPPLPTTAVDLDDVVLDQARRLRSLGDDVAIDLAGVTAGQVRGDAGQLARVVGNLADNARRYAASRVVFGLAEHGDTVVLSVADDGPGIPPDQHERVFERFARVDEARDAGRGGAGLGLAIAWDLVARHGSTIAVDPTFGPGARLVVTLPRA